MSNILLTEECGPYECRANDLMTQRDAFKSEAKALQIQLDQARAELAAAKALAIAATDLRSFEQSPLDPRYGRDDHRWNNLRFKVDIALAAYKEATRGK